MSTISHAVMKMSKRFRVDMRWGADAEFPEEFPSGFSGCLFWGWSFSGCWGVSEEEEGGAMS